jgi:signal transduction histidine kinase
MAINLTNHSRNKGQVASHKLAWSGILGFLVLLGLLLAGQRYIEYGRTIAGTEDRLTAQARVVNENLGANLTFINVLLSDIMRMLDGQPRASSSAINKYLRHQDDLIPGIRTIFVTDAHGRIILSSKEQIIGFDGSGRDYFKTALRISDPARLIITPPFQTVLGTAVVNITRARIGINGKFQGVVSASLDKDYFTTLLSSVLYSPDCRVNLVHAGGDVFISLPDSKSDFTGKNLLRPESLFQRHMDSGKISSIQRGSSWMMGEQRITSFITSKPSYLQIEYPLVISVSRSMDAVLAPWKRDTVVLSALYFLLSGISIVITIVILRYRAEHKRAEEEHLKLHHLESLEILAGGMTHDFNNLLTSIIGFIQIAQLENQQADVVHKSTEAALRNCLQAKELSRRLLTFATGGEHARIVRPVTDIIEASVKEVLKGSPIRANLVLPENLHSVPIDAEQMKQVFFNLVTNAKDAMRDGGTLTIQGENLRIDPNHNLPLASGDYIKLTIGDTGIGIATENLPKIFNPYFSTKDTFSQKGLGLGLAVCYSVIRRHDGLIFINSQEGTGTTISIFLPTFE